MYVTYLYLGTWHMVTVCIVLYSVRLVGNNSLIHLLRILTSLELFLIMNFIPSIQFWLMCTIMVRLFCSFESVFELAGGLRDSQISINNKNLGLLVKKESGVYAKTTFGNLFCVFWLSLLWTMDQFIYVMLLVGFKNNRKCLIKKFI